MASYKGAESIGRSGETSAVFQVKAGVCAGVTDCESQTCETGDAEPC